MNKQALISQYISTPAGRAALAASMASPIRTNLGYLEMPQYWIVGKLDIIKSNRNSVKEFMVDYIRKYKRFDTLRSAIQETCPEYEIVLDKLLVLK